MKKFVLCIVWWLNEKMGYVIFMQLFEKTVIKCQKSCDVQII